MPRDVVMTRYPGLGGVVWMASFSSDELDYLARERRLGRLATADGHLHVVPVGMWRYNAKLGTIDVSGHDIARTRKFRNVRANPRAAFVVDDLASTDPWRPRSVMVEGPAQALEPSPESQGEGVIRIEPETVVSWGIQTASGHVQDHANGAAPSS